MFPSEFSEMNYFELTRDAMKAPHADRALAAIAEDLTRAISNTARVDSGEKSKFTEHVALLAEISSHLAKKGVLPEVTAKAAYHAFINLDEKHPLPQAGRALEAWKQAVDALPYELKVDHVLEIAAAQNISPADSSPLGLAVSEKMQSLPDSPHLRDVAAKLIQQQDADEGLIELLKLVGGSDPNKVAHSAIEKARVLSKLRAEKPQPPELSKATTGFIDAFRKWSSINDRRFP
jgi:hypothetical protein